MSPLFTLLRQEDGSLVVAPAIRALVDGRPVEPGELVPVQQEGTLQTGTLTVHFSERIDQVQVHVFLAGRGAELRIQRVGHALLVVPLARRRARLLVELIGMGPVEDGGLIQSLWAEDLAKTRLDLNQLVHRTRQDLARAGLASEVVLFRHPMGGATELRLSEGTTLLGVTRPNS